MIVGAVNDDHEAIIRLTVHRREPIIVDAADVDPLVGMRLLSGHELTIQAIPGGRVTIAALV